MPEVEAWRTRAVRQEEDVDIFVIGESQTVNKIGRWRQRERSVEDFDVQQTRRISCR